MPPADLRRLKDITMLIHKGRNARSKRPSTRQGARGKGAAARRAGLSSWASFAPGIEDLEARTLLSAALLDVRIVPGGSQVDPTTELPTPAPAPARTLDQLVYLDLGGAANVRFRGPVEVDGIHV